MNESDPRKVSAVAKADRKLAELNTQSKTGAATLTSSPSELVETQHSPDGGESSNLVEANEQLLRAALHAQRQNDACTKALGELSRSMEFDPLTGLANRVRLLCKFSNAIEYAKCHGTKTAVLFLDLNNFKQINDALGHSVGDEVLKLIANRLASEVRAQDTVCRYGGDEFVILLAGISDASEATRIAELLSAAIAAPCRIGEHVFRLSASIGICIAPDDGEDADAVIGCADAAMYRAKHQKGFGSNSVLHDEESVDELWPRLPVIEDLQRPFTHAALMSEESERQYGQLREANTELVMAALDAQELQSAAERLHRKQKESLAVVAHELRNPLTPIRIATEMMALVGPEDIPRYQSIIENEIDHMVRLISDLLDMSRINTGKLRIEKRWIDLIEVVAEAANACRPAMDLRLQRFSVDIPAHAITLDADPVRLTQILRNLLDNASKYTHNGGDIGLSVTVAGENVVIEVSDSGIGISAEALPNVFEPFVQDMQAIVFNGAGMGIGLTVVRELITAHGGTVEAHSAGPGLGSQFVVTLPLAACR